MSSSFSFQIATIPKRTVAFVIDDIVVSIFFVAIFYDQMIMLMSGVSALDQSTAEAMNVFVQENILVFFVIKILYHTVLVWQSGMTLGKYVVKIKVIDYQTEQIPSFVKAFLRALLRVPSELFFYVGFMLAFFTPLRQTFHDKFSNCVVIDA